MLTLGINAVYHDSAAALVDDGIVVAAAEEERFTHVKHGKRPVPFTTWQMPFHAMDYCLKEAGVSWPTSTASRIRTIRACFSTCRTGDPRSHCRWSRRRGDDDRPSRRGTRSFCSYIDQRGERSSRRRAASSPDSASQAADATRRASNGSYVDQHLVARRSAFLAAPFTDTAVLTMDGRGEGVTTSLGRFVDGE